MLPDLDKEENQRTIRSAKNTLLDNLSTIAEVLTVNNEKKGHQMTINNGTSPRTPVLRASKKSRGLSILMAAIVFLNLCSPRIATAYIAAVIQWEDIVGSLGGPVKESFILENLWFWWLPSTPPPEGQPMPRPNYIWTPPDVTNIWHPPAFYGAVQSFDVIDPRLLPRPTTKLTSGGCPAIGVGYSVNESNELHMLYGRIVDTDPVDHTLVEDINVDDPMSGYSRYVGSMSHYGTTAKFDVLHTPDGELTHTVTMYHSKVVIVFSSGSPTGPWHASCTNSFCGVNMTYAIPSTNNMPTFFRAQISK